MKFFLSTLILISFGFGCSSKTERIIKSASGLASANPEKALQILDKALSNETNLQKKLKYISAIEEIIRKKIKKADYYKAILQKKIAYLDDPAEKNRTILMMAKLLIQNYKDDIEALDYLEKIDPDMLNSEERELYFKSVLIAHIENKNYEQALIEVQTLLERKDLSPLERFKIKVLEARTLAESKKVELAEKEYMQLLNKYPNMSKKWKIRTQLALTLEGQKKYKEAIEQLKLYSKEEKSVDPLLEWRIEELTKRLAQQPGGRGRLKR